MKVIYSIVIASLLLFGSAVFAEELMANLPPDPGAAGKATLEGIDSDNDGVRDDVQRWIVMNYPNSQKTRAALTQMAIVNQQFLLLSLDKNLVYTKSLEDGNAQDCLAYVQPSFFYKIDREFEAQIFNTIERTRAYLEHDHLLSGRSFSVRPSSEKKLGCNFDPDVMAN